MYVDIVASTLLREQHQQYSTKLYPELCHLLPPKESFYTFHPILVLILQHGSGIKLKLTNPFGSLLSNSSRPRPTISKRQVQVYVFSSLSS